MQIGFTETAASSGQLCPCKDIVNADHADRQSDKIAGAMAAAQTQVCMHVQRLIIAAHVVSMHSLMTNVPT